MPIDYSLINDVLKHCDIVDIISRYIDVKQKGRNFVALCPFHDDKNPSMQISKDKQIFKCFVCGTGGNAIQFVEKYEHISFFDALKKVAELVGYEDPRLKFETKKIEKDPHISSLEKCINDLNSYYQYALNTVEGEEGLKYFESRFLNEEIRRYFMLGYSFKDGQNTCRYLQSKGNSLKSMELIGIATGGSTIYKDINAGRAIFPICDGNGQVIGFSARRLNNDDSSPKYVNSPETELFHKSSVLYNLHKAKETAKKDGYVYVVEGFMDVFALYKIGIKSVVALMGTAFTKNHIELLRQIGVEIRFCLDGDNAGQMASMAIIEMMNGKGINFQFVDHKGSKYKDCDEILNNEGEDRLKAYINNLMSVADFIINYHESTKALTSIEDRKKLLARFIPFLIGIKSELEFDNYIRKLSNVTKFDIESIKNVIKKARSNTNNISDVVQEFHPERKLLRRYQLAEREILYYMLNDPLAIDFYEKHVETFYDELYRKIADYIITLYKENNIINTSNVISAISLNEENRKDEIIKEILDLSFEQNHPQKIDYNYLNDINKVIQSEKQKLYQKSMLEQMLNGKSELDKARILNDWNKRIQIQKKKKGD